MDGRVLDVVSIGELVVDFISVEQTDTLGNATTFRRYLGSSPANMATYVSKLGDASAVISKTGIGAFGKFLKSELNRHGVVTDYLIMDHRTNTTVVFVSSTAATPDFEDFRSGDYLLTPDEASREAEAKKVLREVYRHVDVTKPSLDDAGRIFGREREPGEHLEMFHEMGPETVVLTMGKEGTLVSEKGETAVHVPARPVEVHDATGAGFLVAHLDGKEWSECVRFAHEVAALKLRVDGHVERMIDRQALYQRLETPAESPA